MLILFNLIIYKRFIEQMWVLLLLFFNFSKGPHFYKIRISNVPTSKSFDSTLRELIHLSAFKE